VDWNSDGEWDIISGDRNGYFNAFIRSGSALTGHKNMFLLSGETLDVGGNSEPNVFDWNDDGKKDLVIGIENYNVRVYLNQATDTWPMFQDFFTVNAGGSPVYFYRVNPYMFDLDQDGRLDLVCGENNGYVHFFRNLGPDSAPVFARGETLKLESGTPVRWTRTAYYYGSRCGFGDWNEDGTPDFLLSTYEGQVELYLGVEPTGVEETPTSEGRTANVPTVVRNVLSLPPAGSGQPASGACLLDAAGRKAMALLPGANDVSRLEPGVYYLRSAHSTGKFVLLR
jgi:hypothetical protein